MKARRDHTRTRYTRIRQEASTCDFTSIKSEAILKALFKVKDDDLTFQRAVELEQEIEEVAKVAKETVTNLVLPQLQRFSK